MTVGQQFFEVDERLFGSKVLLYIGEKVLVYRRDGNTSFLQHCIDLFGGAAEEGESAYDTLAREVREELGLTLPKESVVYAKKYASTLSPGTYAWFVVARLGVSAEKNIVFGDEGEDYYFMTIDDYLACTDAWSLLQERTKEYLKA